MLADLYRYARDRESRLDVETGFATKRIRWILIFKPEGGFVSVAPLGVDKEGKQVKRCPNIGHKTGKRPVRDFLADSAEYAVLFVDAKAERKASLLVKHQFFVDLLDSAGDCIPELRKIALALRETSTISQIQEALKVVGARAQDLITIAIQQPASSVDVLVETDRWHDWWRSKLPEFVSGAKRQRLSERSANRGRCLLSGDLVHPELTHGQVTRLPGGRSSGMSVVSYDGAAWRSYGFQQSQNASIGARAAELYIAGLQELIDETGQTFGNMKVIHWYTGKDERQVTVALQQDVLRMLEDISALAAIPGIDAPTSPKKPKRKPTAEAELQVDEQAAQIAARDFLSSVRSGQQTDLADYHYYALTLSGSSARVMVRGFVTGRFGDLCAAIESWFDDLSIVHRNGQGGLAPFPKFAAVLAAMVRELKDIPAPAAAKLWNCAIRSDEAIPEAFAAQAMRRATLDFITGAPAKHARIGLLRAYLLRKGDRDVKPFLNEDHPDCAYHCGRVLAVLDDIQYAALGDVGAGIVQRYYAAASASPALVLGRLVRLANTGHLPKMEGGLRHWHTQRLAQVWGQVQQSPPTTLSLQQQTLFAMGYYQQKAQPKTRKEEK
jgi:CRISPR-associated protein Csd1